MKFSKRTFKIILIWSIIFSMSTFWIFASNGPKNIMLIMLMLVVPFLLLIQFPYLKKTESTIYFLILFITLASFRNFEQFRISTFSYSLLFIFTFVFYLRLIKSIHLNIILYSKIVKFIFWSFFIILLIQQAGYLLNTPIFNYRVGDLSVMKFNSLASEPSYYGKILTVLMISYITIREVQLKSSYNIFVNYKKDFIVWGAFIYQMISSGSSFALILLFIVILKYINAKYVIYTSLILIVFLFTIILNSENVSIQRLFDFSKAVVTIDENIIFDSDTSAAFRIVPTIRYFKELNILDLDAWIGKGIDFTRYHLIGLHKAIDTEEGIQVGLFPSFIWDFGILSMTILLLIVRKYAILKKIDLVIWLIICLDAPFNTQLFWITLMLMATNKYLKRKHLLPT